VRAPEPTDRISPVRLAEPIRARNAVFGFRSS